MAIDQASLGARAKLVEKLSPRMRQAVRCLIQGHSDDEDAIAERIGIALPTLKTHISRAYARLGVSNRLELYVLYHAFFVHAPCGCAGAEGHVVRPNDMCEDD